MSGASSNHAAIEAGLRALVEGVEFDMPGDGGSLADDLVDVVVEGIAARAIDGQAGAKGRWDDNKDWAEKRKDKVGKPVGVLSGDMLSATELRGEVTTARDELTMRYGTSEFIRRRLEWFSNGSDGKDGDPSGAKNQPARPGLYALDDKIRAGLRKAAEAAIKRHLDRS